MAVRIDPNPVEFPDAVKVERKAEFPEPRVLMRFSRASRISNSSGKLVDEFWSGRFQITFQSAPDMTAPEEGREGRKRRR
jgi:hypothetical protein